MHKIILKFNHWKDSLAFSMRQYTEKCSCLQSSWAWRKPKFKSEVILKLCPKGSKIISNTETVGCCTYSFLVTSFTTFKVKQTLIWTRLCEYVNDNLILYGAVQAISTYTPLFGSDWARFIFFFVNIKQTIRCVKLFQVQGQYSISILSLTLRFFAIYCISLLQIVKKLRVWKCCLIKKVYPSYPPYI